MGYSFFRLQNHSLASELVAISSAISFASDWFGRALESFHMHPLEGDSQTMDGMV
jgi:hypothetical protein